MDTNSENANTEETKLNFALEEYKSLRDEISNKMSSQNKILSLGVGGITVFFGAIFELQQYYLFLVLPFLIFANLYLYKAETRAIIIAGRYLKDLEYLFYENGLGWEHYVEKKRKHYKAFDGVADLIFGSLFAMSVAGALYAIFEFCDYSFLNPFRSWMEIVATGMYLTIILIVIFNWISIKKSATHKMESDNLKLKT
jgi:hypothetical protein